MKKSGTVIIGVVVGLLVYLFLSNVVLGPKASGTNIKVSNASESTVYFYPVCPECDHVSEMYQVNISKGESHRTVHMCEKCFSVYDVEIKR